MTTAKPVVKATMTTTSTATTQFSSNSKQFCGWLRRPDSMTGRRINSELCVETDKYLQQTFVKPSLKAEANTLHVFSCFVGLLKHFHNLNRPPATAA